MKYELTLDQKIADIVNGAFGWLPPENIWPQLNKIQGDMEKFIIEKNKKGQP